MTASGGGEWMTWEEAGERLGIKPDSVRRRARARHWPRQQGNDGLARVLVPLDAIPDARPDAPAPLPADTPETLARLAVAEARLADALGQVDDLRRDRDAWRDQAERLTEQTKPAGPAKWWGRFFRTKGDINY